MMYFARMRYIQLNSIERATLKAGHKNHKKDHVRQRFQALLLSDEGWEVKAISRLCHVRTRTIYTWMDRWGDMGIVGLMVLPGQGKKPKLSIKDKDLVETVKKKP